MAKKNWDRIREQAPSDSVSYRDVYEDQQLERSKLQEKQTPVSRMILVVLFTLLVGVMTYSLASIVGFGVNQVGAFTGENAIINGVYYEITTTQDGAKIWVDDEGNQYKQLPAGEKGDVSDYMAYAFRVSIFKIFITLLVMAITFAIAYQVAMRNLKAQNMLSDTSDINQYQNDQHIALPEEVQRKFDWFPDVGAHSNVQVSSMISHVMLTNKGLKKIQVAKRAKKDMYDKDGNIEYYKGEILLDENGEPIMETKPLIDTDFGDALFSASDLPDEKQFRKYYDTTLIPYNPDGKIRTKQGGKWDTVAEMINHDWTYPAYEPQRPAGAYLVDTEPVNTMVLAITRAGKGQTIIEPTIDMWTRERRPNNILCNDPKGELLQDYYVRGTVRGFQIVQFNLINAMKTDIYNPLAMAAMAAQEGDFTKCAMYVENIADVFFPLDGADDPVWRARRCA